MGRLARVTFTQNANFTVPAGVQAVSAFISSNFTPFGGFNQAGIIGADGNMYMWGDNSSGELGNGAGGTGVASSSPTLVLGGLKPQQLIVDSFYNCNFAINYDGQMYGWGQNTTGILGIGTALAVSSPVLVLGGNRWIQISAATGTVAGIDAFGRCYVWGSNNTAGIIGNGVVSGTTAAYSSPVLVTGTLPLFKQVLCGTAAGSIWALAVNGAAYAWGANANGQLGNGGVTTQSSPVAVLGGVSFATLAVSGAQNFCLGIGKNGNVYAWGQNIYGQLGQGNVTPASSPILVLGLPVKTWVACAVNDGACFVLASDGTVYAWGANNIAGAPGLGALGTGVTSQATSSPVIVAGGITWQALNQPFNETGNGFNAISGNIMYCWGVNTNGSLGNGTSGTASSTPSSTIGNRYLFTGQPLTHIGDIPVTPGQTYAIAINQPVCQFGNTSLGNAITTLVLEFEQ